MDFNDYYRFPKKKNFKYFFCSSVMCKTQEKIKQNGGRAGNNASPFANPFSSHSDMKSA